jgi:hypothetical protein
MMRIKINTKTKGKTYYVTSGETKNRDVKKAETSFAKDIAGFFRGC